MEFIYTGVLIPKWRTAVGSGLWPVNDTMAYKGIIFFHQLLFITVAWELKLSRLTKKLFLQLCDRDLNVLLTYLLSRQIGLQP